MSKEYDLTGQVFGDWKAISPTHKGKIKAWNCVCIYCGKEVVKETRDVRRGTMHCDCPSRTVNQKTIKVKKTDPCSGCVYRRCLSSQGTDKYCAHILITGKRRDRGEDGKCLSYKKRTNSIVYKKKPPKGANIYEW